jgi:hypothetical protein
MAMSGFCYPGSTDVGGFTEQPQRRTFLQDAFN